MAGPRLADSPNSPGFSPKAQFGPVPVMAHPNDSWCPTPRHSVARQNPIKQIQGPPGQKAGWAHLAPKLQIQIMSKQPFIPIPKGEILITERFFEWISPADWFTAPHRHACIDSGVEMRPQDSAVDNRARKTGKIILSHHRAANVTIFWNITDAGRSTTTAILPEEF